MSKFDSYLSDEQRAQILEQRIQTRAVEGYQHELNKATAESLDDEAAVAAADEAIEIISAAIEVDAAALESVKSERVSKTDGR